MRSVEKMSNNNDWKGIVITTKESIRNNNEAREDYTRKKKYSEKNNR